MRIGRSLSRFSREGWDTGDDPIVRNSGGEEWKVSRCILSRGIDIEKPTSQPQNEGLCLHSVARLIYSNIRQYPGIADQPQTPEPGVRHSVWQTQISVHCSCHALEPGTAWGGYDNA